MQIELAHSVTPIDIVDDHPPAEDLDDDGAGLTRVREIVSIDPDVAAFTRPSAITERKSAAPLPDVPRFDSPERADAVDEATPMREPAASAPPRGRRPDDRPAPDGGRAARPGIRRASCRRTSRRGRHPLGVHDRVRASDAPSSDGSVDRPLGRRRRRGHRGGDRGAERSGRRDPDPTEATGTPSLRTWCRTSFRRSWN